MRQALAKIKRILLDDSIDNVCFIGGVMLLGWTLMAIRGNGGHFLEEFASWYPIGGPVWWAVMHLIASISLILVAFVQFPNRMLSIFGLWLSAFWGWQFIVRLDTAQQVGNANNVMMVVLGLMIFWRAGKE